MAKAADLVEELVPVAGLELSVVRPRDSEALLDEQAFEQEEFLPYWAELWPSSLALARLVAIRSLGGRTVVELGCGLGLPSIAAALRGGRVLATDWSPEAVAFTERNARLNAASLETAVVDWARPGPLVEVGSWDLVLASDVLYERRNVEVLLALLPRLVRGGGEVLLTDPGRPAAGAFLAGAAERFRVASAPVRGGRVVLHRLRPL